MRLVRQISVVTATALLAGGAGYGLATLVGVGDNPTAVAVLVAGAALVGVAIAGFAIIMVSDARCRHLLLCGIPAEATILRVRRTGAALHSRHEAARPVLRIDMEAHLPAYQPIFTHATMAMHESEADRLVPGARVPIRYDPDHPARVALDMAS
jgi:hypothetical protein